MRFLVTLTAAPRHALRVRTLVWQFLLFRWDAGLIRVFDDKLWSFLWLLSRLLAVEHQPKLLGVRLSGQVISAACRCWSRQHYIRLKLSGFNSELAWIELSQWWSGLLYFRDVVIAAWLVSHRFKTTNAYLRQARPWLRHWDDSAVKLRLLERISLLWIPSRPIVDLWGWNNLIWRYITTELAYVILEVTSWHALNSRAIRIHHWLQYLHRLELVITLVLRCCLLREKLHIRSALLRCPVRPKVVSGHFAAASTEAQLVVIKAIIRVQQSLQDVTGRISVHSNHLPAYLYILLLSR